MAGDWSSLVQTAQSKSLAPKELANALNSLGGKQSRDALALSPFSAPKTLERAEKQTNKTAGSLPPGVIPLLLRSPFS
jgi:hypothetical protein